MGLNVGLDFQLEFFLCVDVLERLFYLCFFKIVLLNKGSIYLLLKKVFIVRKFISLLRNLLQLFIVIKGVLLEKKEQVSLLEFEVFNSLFDEIFFNSRKNLILNSGKNYVNNSFNLRILNFLLRDKDVYFLDNIVIGCDKLGFEIYFIS